MKKSKILNAAIMEVVENQINGNDPPETKQTLDRLIVPLQQKWDT